MKKDLKKLLKDDLAGKILVFFYQNQASVDSVGGVSTWVNDDRKKVLAVLDELVRLGVLDEDSTGAIKGYCYTRDKKVMKTVEELVQDV
ncbi:MAG: hypothetical protein P9L88_04905 [Candidatus Tantalella remota]|nr:hypothetical protein [Candidatus Tantalella remota]